MGPTTGKNGSPRTPSHPPEHPRVDPAPINKIPDQKLDLKASATGNPSQPRDGNGLNARDGRLDRCGRCRGNAGEWNKLGLMWMVIHRFYGLLRGGRGAGVAFLDGLNDRCANGDALVGWMGVSGVEAALGGIAVTACFDRLRDFRTLCVVL